MSFEIGQMLVNGYFTFQLFWNSCEMNLSYKETESYAGVELLLYLVQFYQYVSNMSTYMCLGVDMEL